MFRSASRLLHAVDAPERRSGPPRSPRLPEAVRAAIPAAAAIVALTILAPAILLLGVAASPLVLLVFARRLWRSGRGPRPAIERLRERWGRSARVVIGTGHRARPPGSTPRDGPRLHAPRR